MRLIHLVSLIALSAAMPALAQSSSADPNTGEASMSEPPNFSKLSSSEAPPPEASSSSDEMSHMSTPPNFTSSSEEAPASSEELPPASSEEAPPPSGPPVASADALKLVYDACTDISGGDPAAYDRANNGGWTPNDQDDVGPYNAIYSGFRTVDGYGEVDIWGSVNSYPTQSLGYCRVDFPDPDGLINFADMTKLGDLKGRIEDRGEGNVYGAWESSDKKLLVIGDRNAGQVEIEFNLLLGDKKK
jgi:hypothetical protein